MSRLIPDAEPLAIHGIGAFTPAGTTAVTAFGAARLGLKFFEELPWRDAYGVEIVGALTPLDLAQVEGVERLVTMAALALEDCAPRGEPSRPEAPAPLLLCLPMPAERFVAEGVLGVLCDQAGARVDAASSAVFPSGRAAIFDALAEAERRLSSRAVSEVYLCGVDSLVDHDAFDELLRAGRLKTETTEGIVAGEGAVVLRLRRAGDPGALAWIAGRARAEPPPARVPGKPDGGAAPGSGLVAAARAALAQAALPIAEVGAVVHDAAGDRAGFREAAMAMTRLRPRSDPPPAVWAPAGCVGEMGAALAPFALGLAAFFIAKRVTVTGPVGDAAATLVLVTGDYSGRGAAVVTGPGAQARGAR